MIGFEFFSGSCSLTKTFINAGDTCFSLDYKQYRFAPKLDFQVDFLAFNYDAHIPQNVDFLYFGLPCTCFSKASGGYHFTKEWFPLTDAAHLSIDYLYRVFEIINKYPKATWYIENPAGRLYDFLQNWKSINYPDHIVYRFDMMYFDFPTKKQTDLFTNSSVPFMTSPVHRVNGKYQKVSFDNLTTNQRQCYPKKYCDAIVQNCKLSRSYISTL
jgi:hypothetical protein